MAARGTLGKAIRFHQNGVDFARAMHSADEDLFDIGSAAGPRYENRRAAGHLPAPPPLAPLPSAIGRSGGLVIG